ncbi:MAG: hexose kinase [Candidatus Omnitrophica bacterium]|nr:hexose kinase [Candidatus Omnitrophota bacterium]MCB9721195.1 hexose kinase [Candidatus Omnitrophota bacterium]
MPGLDSGQRYILTVTLNTTVDTMLRYRRAGGCQRFDEETRVAGGKGLNVSRALRRLGRASLAAGIVGGCTGRDIEQLLRREGLRHRFYRNDAESRQNLILCLPELSPANRVFRQTPSISGHGYREFRRLYRDALLRADMVVLSGSVLDGLSPAVYADLIRDARRREIPVLLDASGTALREGLKARPTFIKPNLTEIQHATGIRVRTLNDAVRAAAFFRRMDLPNIYLSLGERGAIGCNHNELWYAKAQKVAVRNTVGCGDAFVAAVCAAHLDKLSLSAALSLAVAAGTVSATNFVPGLVDPNAVSAMAARIKLRKLPL